MKTVATYSFFLVLFAVLGFSHEFLFVNINKQLYKLYYHNPDITIPAQLSFLNVFDYATLYYTKYLFTLLYFAAYFLVSWWAVKVLCKNRPVSKWIIYIYSLLLILSGVAMAFNYFVHHQLNGNEYTFSRWLMGIAQSPLVAFFTIASATLYDKLKPEHKL